MSSSSVAINVVQVEKIFGKDANRVAALDGVSLTINENEFFTLLGPSGCGKTTLLRLIAGFEQPTSGRIYLHGSDISNLPPYERPVNTVFQNYALFPHMTVGQNIAFALEMLEKPKPEIEQTVSRMLSLVKMEELRDRRTDQISGGQQQRVALARALAPHPKVLLLDEPLSALDYKLRKEMQIELKRLQHETGITFVFVTHDQEEALTMSDRVGVMNNGNILQVGPPHEIYDHPSERFVADFIGDTNFVTADVLSKDGLTLRLKLSSGVEISVVATEAVNRNSVTLAVRPEQTILLRETENVELQGDLQNVVYIGTDTHYHVKTEDEKLFTVRVQNARGRQQNYEIGERVGIKLDPNMVQVLRD
ncbi:MAG: spermidine/putrescine transport system ATP-binding protein [Parasphingorhabdus sp.]|jgi:spermidine/putrescine transport system ATP-binding protein